jgi:DNA (cytosine-5)-methyltransferase 1
MPRLLDLFCGAGGCGMGYHRAGFDVVGVDLKNQKRYPFEFHQGDAVAFLAEHGHEFDAIHASPPCQKFSAMTKRWGRQDEHPDLVGPIRELLKSLGKPYVIENVVGSPLIDPLMLCGTMFGLQTSEGSQLRRHRLFESNCVLLSPGSCQHNDGSAIGVYGGGQHPNRRRPATIGIWGNSGGSSKRDGLDHYGVDARKEAMGIDWMTGPELSQAIPPAYTEFIGRQLMGYCMENQQ